VLQTRHQLAARLRADHAELSRELARAEGDTAAAKQAIHADVLRLRGELAEEERRVAGRNRANSRRRWRPTRRRSRTTAIRKRASRGSSIFKTSAGDAGHRVSDACLGGVERRRGDARGK